MKDNIVKSKTIYLDQRVAEEFCNFRCDYCGGFYPSEYSLAKDKDNNLKVPKEWHEKVNLLPEDVRKHFKNGSKMENFYQLCFDILDKTKRFLYADILKISGGEITTNEDLVGFIKKIHKNYLSVQILSNGFNIKEKDILEYKKMGNINFQISLDGVTFASNYAKSHNSKITEKVIQNVETMVKEGVGVEINCVLTKYNTDKILEFLEKFKNANNFVIVPRPVRGEPKKELAYSKMQIEFFEKMIYNNFDKYSNILPPKAYFDRLIKIMKLDRRNAECYIPFFVESIDGYGNVEECPIGLITASECNIFEMQKDNILPNKHIFKNNILCQNCTNQYEMFNLYVEGKITKDEIKKMPSLNSDEIVCHIDEIKTEIIKEEIKKVLEKEYEIKTIEIIKNETATDNNVYEIYSNKKKYIVKIYNNKKHTESMVALHKKLIKSYINVPKVICTIKNKGYANILNDNYMVVYSFIEGGAIGWNNERKTIDKEIIMLIAKELRRFHTVTSDCNEFNLPAVPFETDNNARKSALHFDLTRNNIFKQSDGKISIIDFDDAKYGESICDIAILIANLFFSKTRGIDLEGMKEFINQYYMNDLELKKKEEPLIKQYALEWIKYILDGNNFDTSTTESFEIRYKLINENM